MSHNLPIGQLIEDDQERDAIHIAIAPVIASMDIKPGDHLGFVAGSQTEVVCIQTSRFSWQNTSVAAIGIADPFLRQDIRKGQKFWMFMYPNTITSLRHDWTHPAFTKKPETSDLAMEESIRWIQSYADSLDLEYDDLIQAAKEYRTHGHYLSRGGLLEGVSTSPEFWFHYERVTGDRVPFEDREDSFFSCSC